MRLSLPILKKDTDFPAVKPFKLFNRKKCNGFTHPCPDVSLGLRRVSPSQKKPRDLSLRGFTFIELLIVSSILAIVMLAVYSSFISGMRLWQRSKNLSRTEFKVTLGLEKFSSSLRQSIDFPPIGFYGTAGKLSFPFLDDLEIARVSFEFDPRLKSLQRIPERYRDILTGKQPAAKTFLAAIEGADFSYYYFDNVSQQYRWKDEWGASGGIPLAIKITIKFKDGFKENTVFIPIS